LPFVRWADVIEADDPAAVPELGGRFDAEPRHADRVEGYEARELSTTSASPATPAFARSVISAIRNSMRSAYRAS
jgi:hypothetical protein